MNAEVKKTAQTFRSVYMKEKSELNTLKVKRKIINCLEEKGYAAVDCDNQIDMVNREKVEEFWSSTFFASGKYLLDILYGMEFSRRYEENIALNSRYEKSGKNLLWRFSEKESD